MNACRSGYDDGDEWAVCLHYSRNRGGATDCNGIGSRGVVESAVSVRLTVAVLVVASRLMLVVLNSRVGPLGTTAAESVTVPLKVETLLTFMMTLAEEP